MQSCDLCSTKPLNLKLRLPSFSILECRSCGLLVQCPLPSQEDLDAIYDDPEYWSRPYFSNCGRDYRRDDKTRMFEEGLERISRLCPAKGPLLDVGCGTGVFLDIARKAGWEVSGIDSSRYVVECAKRNFGVQVRHGLAEEILFPGNQYRAITLWDVIEHVRSPIKLVNSLSKALLPEGIILIFTPRANSFVREISPLLDSVIPPKPKSFVEMIYSPLHLHYFNKPNMRTLLQENLVRVLEEHQAPMAPKRAGHGTPARQILLRYLDMGGSMIGKSYRFITIGQRSQNDGR